MMKILISFVWLLIIERKTYRGVYMGFTELQLKNEYRTSNDSVSEDFYKPILRCAVTYDRAVVIVCTRTESLSLLNCNNV